MTDKNRAEVDAILAELPPNTGPVAVEIREATLADEVRRLRAQVARWETVRRHVTFAHSVSEVTHERHDEEHEGGKRAAFWLVQQWMDAADKAGEGSEGNG